VDLAEREWLSWNRNHHVLYPIALLDTDAKSTPPQNNCIKNLIMTRNYRINSKKGGADRN
jgi:hypothetical protein